VTSGDDYIILGEVYRAKKDGTFERADAKSLSIDPNVFVLKNVFDAAGKITGGSTAEFGNDTVNVTLGNPIGNTKIFGFTVGSDAGVGDTLNFTDFADFKAQDVMATSLQLAIGMTRYDEVNGEHLSIKVNFPNGQSIELIDLIETSTIDANLLIEIKKLAGTGSFGDAQTELSVIAEALALISGNLKFVIDGVDVAADADGMAAALAALDAVSDDFAVTDLGQSQQTTDLLDALVANNPGGVGYNSVDALKAAYTPLSEAYTAIKAVVDAANGTTLTVELLEAAQAKIAALGGLTLSGEVIDATTLSEALGTFTTLSAGTQQAFLDAVEGTGFAGLDEVLAKFGAVAEDIALAQLNGADATSIATAIADIDVYADLSAFTNLGEAAEAAVLADLLLNRPEVGFASLDAAQAMLGLVIEVHTGVGSTLVAAKVTLGGQNDTFFTLEVQGQTLKIANIDKIAFTDTTASVVGSGGYASVGAAVAATPESGFVLVASGSYVLGNTLNVTKAVTITGAGEGATTLVTAAAANGIEVTANNVTIQDLSVDAAKTTGYGVKVNPGVVAQDAALTGFTLQNVTVSGAGKTEIDLNGVDNSSLINVNADGKGTAGVGIGLADSTGITLTDITTTGNNWGSIGLYSKGASHAAGTNGITFTGTYSKGEAAGIYADESGTTAVTGLNLSILGDTVFKVQNANNPTQMYFFGSEGEAIAYAKAMRFPEKSVITFDTTSNSVDAEPGTTFIVGNGMSIQAAATAALDGAVINVREGNFAETVTVSKDVTITGAGENTVVTGAFGITANGATVEALKVVGGATVQGSDAGIYVAADGVSLKNLVLTGPDQGQSGGTFRGVLTEGGKGGLTVDNVTASGWATGIYLNPGAGTVVVQNSTLTGNYVGLSVDRATGVTVENTVLGGTVEDLGFGPGATVTTWTGVTLAGGLVGNYSGDAITLGSTTITTLGQSFDNVFVAASTGTAFAAPTAGANHLYLGSATSDSFVASGGVDRIEGGSGTDTVNLGALGLSLASFTKVGTALVATSGANVTTMVGIETLIVADSGSNFASTVGGLVTVSLVSGAGFPVKLVGAGDRPDLYFAANDLPGVAKAAATDLPNEAIQIVLGDSNADYAATIDLTGVTFTSINISLAAGQNGPEQVGPIFAGDASKITVGTGIVFSNVAPGLRAGEDGATALDTVVEGDAATVVTVTQLLAEFMDADLGTSLGESTQGGKLVTGGIAVIGFGVGTVAGQWEFKEAGRSDFQTMKGFLDGALSQTNALLLNAGTQLRFVADDTGENANAGTVPALQFVAVDSSQAFNGGRQFTSPQQARTADVTIRGNDTPYSAEIGSVSQTITPQNDPGSLGAAKYTLTGVNEDAFTGSNGLFADDASIDGDLVSTIFAGSFDDPDTAGADTINGIAVVANGSSQAKGKWQYSSDAGATFTDIGTVSAANALLLDDTAMLRFVPAANYNGAAPELTVRGIDATFTGRFSNLDVFYADLSGADATGRGTAFTKGTADLGLDVTAVADAYVFSAQSGGSVDNTSAPDSIGTFGGKPIISLSNFDHGTGSSADKIVFKNAAGDVVTVDLGVTAAVGGLGVAKNNDSNVLVHAAGTVDANSIGNVFINALTGTGREGFSFGEPADGMNALAQFVDGVPTFNTQGAGFAILTDQAGVTSLWYSAEMNPYITAGNAGSGAAFAPTLIGYLAGEAWTTDHLDGTPRSDAPTLTLDELKLFTQADFGM
jgi:hypothetical protein